MSSGLTEYMLVLRTVMQKTEVILQDTCLTEVSLKKLIHKSVHGNQAIRASPEFVSSSDVQM